MMKKAKRRKILEKHAWWFQLGEKEILKLLFTRDGKTASCGRKARLRAMQSGFFCGSTCSLELCARGMPGLSRVRTSHG